MNAADTWGIVTIAAPDANIILMTCGDQNNEATAAVTGRAVEDGRMIKKGVTIEAMVRVAFGAIDPSGNLLRGTGDGRDSESVVGA